LKPAEGEGLTPTTSGGFTMAGFGFLPDAWNGDRIVFSASLADSTDLWQIAIAPKTCQIKATPQPLTTGANRQFGPSFAADGRMVFATVDQRLDLWTLPIDANLGKALGKPQPLARTGANSLRPSLSTNGKRLAFLSNKSGNLDVWLRAMDSGKETALTATPWDEGHPWIAPDGSKVAYASWEAQNPVVYVLALGAAAAEKLCDGIPYGWSPDSRRVLYYKEEAYRSIDVVTRQRADVIRHEKYNLHRAQFSPDGNWLAFHMPVQAEQNRSPVFIAPLQNGVAAGESEWIQVTDGTGSDSLAWWSPDGGMLYFLSKRDGFNCIWAQRLDKKARRPTAAPFDVAHFHGARYQVNGPVFGPGVSSDRLVFTLSESTGNVWTAKPEGQR